MDVFNKVFLLLFVLLNPFSMSIYLLELVKAFDFFKFASILLWAAFMSLFVFIAFALSGEALFENVFQVRFFSFQIFGGITFLIIGIRLILGSGPSVGAIRPDAEHLSGAIAMPFIVGPGTISASVFAGTRLEPVLACSAIVLALTVAVIAILAFKLIHDYVQKYNGKILQRYTEVAGRITALFTGSFAVELIFKGIDGWMAVMKATP